MQYDTSIQSIVFRRLVQSAAECVCWSTVEGASLTAIRHRLLLTEQEAEKAQISKENIRLALQIGEYLGRFSM